MSPSFARTWETALTAGALRNGPVPSVRPRVLHVVDSGKRRGSEIFASDLVRALNSIGVTQKVAILWPPLEIEFEAPLRVLPSSGRRVPGIRTDPAILLGLRSLIRLWGADVVQAHAGDSF